MDLDGWLSKALQASGLKQVELSEFISEKLGRTIDKGAVNRMLSGARKISGDELLAIADACNFPIPSSNMAISAMESIVKDRNAYDFLMQIDLSYLIKIEELRRIIVDGLKVALSKLSLEECESIANIIVIEMHERGDFTIYSKAGNGAREMLELFKLLKKVRRDKAKGVKVYSEDARRERLGMGIRKSDKKVD